VDASSGKPALSWKKITGAAGYEIYRSENGGNWELIKTQTAVTFRDDTAVAGNTYRYRILTVATKQGCDSFNSAEQALTATCAQPKIQGKVGEIGKPELNWESVEGATKYVVYRSTSSSKNYKIIDETTALTYTDATAAKGKT
jgi:fibronectin type 3 domain-containing protein